ncbi:hypothetical protein FOPE_04863 [Fonsecaea pedrosoi]|nr:hypothetical protein FOPE_04863 [Fonsecaea pedrosoi]
MSKQDNLVQAEAADDELDECTGCAENGCRALMAETEEQLRMNDCYYEKKDWRACKAEMEAFRQCWKRKGNEERTQSKDAPSNEQ